MIFRVLACLSVPGSDSVPNEDAAGCGEGAAWVLDGATGLAEHRLLPGLTDAAWLVGRYDALLRERADRTQVALRDLIGGLIGEVAASFDAARVRGAAERHELPSAGLALVRCADGALEFARLGDCRAILASPDGGVVSTAHSPLARLDGRVVERMRALRDSGEVRTHAQARSAVRDDLRANRALLNTPHGYWVLGTQPEAASHMEVGTLPLARGGQTRGLLVSDGFYRLVDTFGACRDDAELLRRSWDLGPEEMLKRLRAIEDADPECEAYPRLKPKDDASMVLFEAAV